ncbi:shikimate kinase [Helicobacter sp. MIT 03-1614]|uniref:Shikimate kinase n=1 Tax=Helicobacter hepaticus (strain ATCC 51449 / 3B1) TaxID=235279 RepID=AROK_HELHP|nr:MULTISPECIES: shikimate kinase [Helicobacter]Q7VIH7.1 RecName: Full=Shikimate kinase; Short=SK [Helicobacter hepaticus ATCC 51449]AAP77225.1 shikimate kinase [Helicobacter hepaticus ATCC 51449]TLD90000.1 shikimate kinase [Helicobacter sp. MIT 03-1614]
MENIVLIGFMGSGKTTIGREIALLGGRFLLDTDQIIEQNMGKSINEIFESVGESGFRRIESQLILWLSANVKNAVIATGGGMPIYNDVAYLGYVFWLDMSFESILKRLTITEQEKRPLFSDISKARQLYNERKSIYKKQSKYIINGDASALEIARKIIECMDKEVQE